MDLRNLFKSFRWRIFFPIVVMMWVLVFVLMAFQYNREQTMNEDAFRRQMARFNSRVLYAHANGRDIGRFLVSLDDFFDDSRFDGVRISVYSKEDFAAGNPPEALVGQPVTRDIIDAPVHMDLSADNIMLYVKEVDGQDYYFMPAKSKDGKILVFTVMPRSESLLRTINTADRAFWMVLITLLVAVTIVAWIITSGIQKNIHMLQLFARDANNNRARFDETRFPHNELGDISREIVKICRDRGEALARSKKEHDIALHAVEEKARLKRQLTNNINHELKTPIGVIKGYLDTVLSADDMDESTRTYFLRRAQDNVNRMCSLLNDVSMITRLEEGSSNIPLQAVDFHDLVFGIDNDFSTSGVTGNMTFEYEIPLDCEVKGNTTLLAGAISNLIKNAVAHSRGTAMGLKLVAESDKYYTFSFWDNGTGVEEQHIPRLFERFYRVDSGRSRKAGGTGLGLPIVKKTIDAMGGSLSVHNRSTGGLEFLFTLEKWS